MGKECIICGEKTDHPFAAAVEHLRPIDWEQRKLAWGTLKTFGFMAAATLIFPFLNTIVHWKYRKFRLEINDEVPVAEKEGEI